MYVLEIYWFRCAISHDLKRQCRPLSSRLKELRAAGVFPCSHDFKYLSGLHNQRIYESLR